jgi:hypothetical protein
MSDTQAGVPEPVIEAIKPFWHKTVSLWKFYWQIAWRPRLFADEYLQLPTASSITKAVKHTLWLAGFWTALIGFVASASSLMGAPKSELPLGSFGTTFLTVTMFALQAIPMGGVLWLLTRRNAISISQALMVNIYTFNIFFASTLLVYTVILAIAVPFELLVYYVAFLPTAEATDASSFQTWILGSSFWKWFIFLMILMGGTCLCVWGRIFFFVAPTLISEIARRSFWQGLWRYLVSVLVGAMLPNMLILGLIFSLLVSMTSGHIHQ